ncbi:MAG: DUF3179 domain-containing protein [Flavobacteriales bacterium]|nr:DUF3179 domain-containing protein [Flavobacteriales bacterium]
MKNLKRIIYPFFLAALFIFSISSCTKEANTNVSTNNNDWLIPYANISNTPANFLSFKSIDSPKFELASKLNHISDFETVVSLKENNVIRVYLLKDLQGVEIVNDRIDDLYFTISYCPLTCSCIAFNRKINGKINSFGVSGMLYNDNLMPFDRDTESIWSQMLGESVNGKLISTKIKRIMLVQSSWKYIKDYYPNAQVLVNKNNTSSRAIQKTRNINLGVLDKFGIKVFTMDDKIKTSFISSLNTFSVLYLKEYQMMTAFESINSSFSLLSNSVFPNVLIDQTGNYIDIYGYVTKGPKRGQRVLWAPGYIAETWAFNNFYDTVEFN